jgi:hypothetical protein
VLDHDVKEWMWRGKETQFSLNSVMDWRSVFGTFGFEERWMLMGIFFKGVEMGSLIKIRSLPDVNQGIERRMYSLGVYDVGLLVGCRESRELMEFLNDLLPIDEIESKK